jgi:hypothetical protein
MDWKSLPLLDIDLVKYLRLKYPPIEYTIEKDEDEFVRDAIYRAGQRSIADKIEHIIQLQKKGK